MATPGAAAAAPATATEAATASQLESESPRGRPDSGAAVARTEVLYAQHGRLVAGLCRALLRDHAEAEDAAQQTFLAAHRALLNGTTPREPAAWLATIARNECCGRIRGRMREPLPTAEIDDEASTGADPLAEAIRNADLAAMWRAIGELPRPQRDALLLREFGGLSYDELSEALSVSGSAVESLLFRARQGVRLRLETAYAGFAGASWLESLTRLAAGLGSSMAPVAAKAVAVGVGAAVVTGGAVVAPQVLERHAHVPPAAKHAPAHAATTQQASVTSAPNPVATLVSVNRRAHAGVVVRSVPGGDGPDGSSRSGAESAAGGREDGSSSGSGEATSGRAAADRLKSGEGGDRNLSDGQQQRDAATTGAASAEGHDSGGGGSASGSGDGSGGDGGNGSSGGGGGDGGGSDKGAVSGDGGAGTTTTNPALMVTLPVVPPLPVEGSDGHGGDG